jgi:antitoxin PrlF
MTSATLTSKGQVTIPVSVRDALGLATGDKIEFVRNDATGSFEVVPANQSVRMLKGMIARPGRAVSVEDMHAAIAEQGASAE